MRVACAGGRSRSAYASTSSSRRSTGRTTSSALLGSLDAQTHRAFPRRRRRPERRRPRRAGARRPRRRSTSLRAALGTRSLAGAERGAPAARPPTSSPFPTTTASTRPISSRASRSGSRPTRASTASAAGRSPPTERTAGRWPSRARRDHARTPSGTPRTRTRSSCAGAWSSASAGFDEGSGSARARRGLGRGDRLPRPRAPRWARGSSTTRRSSSRIRSSPCPPDELVALGRRDGASVGTSSRRTRYPAATVVRMLVRAASRALAFAVLLDRTRARFQPRRSAAASAGCAGRAP